MYIFKLGSLLLWFCWQPSMITYCNAAEINITLDGEGYQYQFVPYNVKEATSITFKVRGNGSALIGLFPENKTDAFEDYDFYEISLGEPENPNTIAMRTSGRGPIATITTTTSNFLNETEYQSFWISWANNRITCGRGSKAGEKEILGIHGTQKNKQLNINFLAFGSYNSSVEWTYYNVEPLEPPPPDVCDMTMPIPRVTIDSDTRDIINDGDLKTCLNVTTTLPSIYLQLLFHEDRPLVVKFLFEPLPSCKKAKLMVITKYMWGCPLVDSGQEEGLTFCMYNCSMVKSSKIVVGFVQSWTRPPVWSLCEVMTVRETETEMPSTTERNTKSPSNEMKVATLPLQ